MQVTEQSLLKYDWFWIYFLSLLLSLTLFYFIGVNKTTVTCKIQFKIIFHLERFRHFLLLFSQWSYFSQWLESRSFMQHICKTNILEGPKEGKHHTSNINHHNKINSNEYSWVNPSFSLIHLIQNKQDIISNFYTVCRIWGGCLRVLKIFLI